MFLLIFLVLIKEFYIDVKIVCFYYFLFIIFFIFFIFFGFRDYQKQNVCLKFMLEVCLEGGSFLAIKEKYCFIVSAWGLSSHLIRLKIASELSFKFLTSFDCGYCVSKAIILFVAKIRSWIIYILLITDTSEK